MRLHGKFPKSPFNTKCANFREVHSTQHALLRLIESWQKELDQSGFVETILIGLSEVYDWLPHYRKQRTNTGSAYSD